MSWITILKEFNDKNDWEGAIGMLSDELRGDIDAETRAKMLFERGKLYWKTGDRSKATCDYMASAHLWPESPARHALEQAREIEAFFNPDLLNP